jgi:polysaccharide pyruvyl transferase WcaK-like protein
MYAMDTHPKMSDHTMHSSIIGCMKWRDERFKILSNQDFVSVANLFSKYELIITQRFHGIILAELLKIPYIAICHHDKLSTSSIHNGLYISYYGLNKKTLLDMIDIAPNIEFVQKPGNFDELINAISSILV